MPVSRRIRKASKKIVAPAPELPRIYVLVPQTVTVVPEWGGYEGSPHQMNMEPGRLMAQVSHVVRKMQNYLTNVQWKESARRKDESFNTCEEFTTIVLQVRNSDELSFMFNVLNGHISHSVWSFHDHNPDFYETEKRVLTAICTSPVFPSEVAPYVKHLELYR